MVAMTAPDAWPLCNVTEEALKARVEGGLLHPVLDKELPEWIVPPVNVREPNPPTGYVVSFLVFHDRGVGTLATRFMRALAYYYGVELHNFNPNSIAQVTMFGWCARGTSGSPSIGTSGCTYS